MGRPDELHIRHAVGQLIRHDLRNRQAGNGGVQRLLQSSAQRCTCRQALQKDGLDLAIVLDNKAVSPLMCVRPQVSQVLAPFLGQPLAQRFGGFAVLDADRDWNQLLEDFRIACLRRHRRDMRGQPPGRGKRRERRPSRRQTLRLQLLEQRASECLAQFPERLGRQFFDKQLDQQVLACHICGGVHAPLTKLGAGAFFGIRATHSGGAIGKPRRSRLS